MEAAIRRYCQQNRYQIRGALEFIIKEGEPEAEGESRSKEKIRIRCRYTAKANAEPVRIPAAIPVASNGNEFPYEENPTVANMAQEFTFEEVATLLGQASANLTIHPVAGVPFQFGIHKPALTIGRSSRAGNDLVLQGDGLVSKRHARVEREADGNYTLYDLGSTNGVKVNGKRVDNYTLQSGDEFTIGNTRLVFEAKKIEASPSFNTESSPVTALFEEPLHRSGGIFGGAAASLMEGGGSSSPPTRRLRPQTGRLQRLDEKGDVAEEFTLGSETLIGRGITNDIVLPDRSVSTRHACLLFDIEFYTIESLTDAETTLNAVSLDPRLPIRLTDGDIIGVGSLRLRFLLQA